VRAERFALPWPSHGRVVAGEAGGGASEASQAAKPRLGGLIGLSGGAAATTRAWAGHESVNFSANSGPSQSSQHNRSSQFCQRFEASILLYRLTLQPMPQCLPKGVDGFSHLIIFVVSRRTCVKL
jgi:hypothetical protein